MTIAVAVSGGVDSLYALAALRSQGEDVFALHARFLSPDPRRADPAPGLAEACRVLHVPFHVLDLTDSFRRLVMEPFIHAYTVAQTPNPCALCNRRLKFGLLMDAARELGADRLATGHYATLTNHPVYGPSLGRASDSIKDQSYFLALVPIERLQAAVFPLARRTKNAVRVQVVGQGITVPLPHESQEICFVPNDDYRTFLESEGCVLPGPGAIVLTDGRRIGSHNGLWRYTEGQRRGLGVAWSEPLYVIRKNLHDNTLVAGSKAETTGSFCTAGNVNLLADPAVWPAEIFVQVRYRQVAAPAEVTVSDNGLHIRFHTPQPLPAPGQVAAVFDAQGHALAGGIINR